MAKSAAVANVDEKTFSGRIKSWPQRTKSFYNDVRTEMKKVTTPSRKEVQATTGVVVITVFIFGIYFWVIDTVIGRGLDSALRYLTSK